MSVTDLQQRIRQKKTPLALGLRPELEKLSPKILKNFTDMFGPGSMAEAEALRYHGTTLLDAAAETLPAVMLHGASYLRCGMMGADVLSGGEAQRVKLATELSRRATGRTIYILDEPTTGLHADDVRKLLDVLQRLTDAGNTVLVIEHNLDVIKCADYIVDLGPEGGSGGGTVVACGTPEQVAAVEASYTGQYLKKYLK